MSESVCASTCEGTTVGVRVSECVSDVNVGEGGAEGVCVTVGERERACEYKCECGRESGSVSEGVHVSEGECEV